MRCRSFGSSAAAVTPTGAAVAAAAAVALRVGGAEGAAAWTPAVVAFAAVVAWGLLRIRVDFDDERLVVVNVWRTHAIAWADVDAVESAALWPSPAALFALRPGAS